MLKELLFQKMRDGDLTTRQVAKMVGTSHTTIVRALRGEDVDLDTLLKLGKWLGVKPSTLLNSMEKSRDAYPEQIALLLGRNPSLAKEFEKAMQAIEVGDVEAAIIEDIASYAAFKINLNMQNKKPR